MHLKDFIESFQEIVWLIRLGVTDPEILRVEIYKKTAESQKIHKSCIFNG